VSRSISQSCIEQVAELAIISERLEKFDYEGASLIAAVSGEPSCGDIIFLHGWGGNRRSLYDIGALFQCTHRIHMLDLPGFGGAPPPPHGWGSVQYADIVQQYMLRHCSDKVILVGHSFGGRVGVRLAAKRLAQIKGLVMMGTPGLPQSFFSRRRIRILWIRWLRALLRFVQPHTKYKLMDWHTRRYGSKDYQNVNAELRSVLVSVVTENLTESAGMITCPTLLLWGTDDAETPVWLARRYKKLMGDKATLNLLPHKDHYLFQGTGAHLCGFEIREWLGVKTNA
jgi:pimeloyl-ACP methyl ester carboxylesterase